MHINMNGPAKKIDTPRNRAPYRVYWNWELTHDCNYRCSYCETWRDDVPTPLYPGPDRWKQIWDRMYGLYGSCVVRFSGGEPSIYPGFIDIIAAVARNHSIDITTNLSFDEREFARKVEPGSIAVSASFHPEFNDIHDFLERVLFLHNSGFISTICYVAYPPQLDRLEYFKKTVEDKNIMFKFLPFTGKYGGREYPRDYTSEERELIYGAAVKAKDPKARELNTKWYEWNAGKRDSENGVKKGRVCLMGYMYAVIHPDGEVTRCCAGAAGRDSGVLGNIIHDGDFRLLGEPRECRAANCPCFKAMLAESDSWHSMWEALPHKKYKNKTDGNH
ncbi:MAG: radical SAM protein [Elusimicrobia bacterium]|nr:radical SAM protein [Elusimicrobiota bacterium]